MKLLLDQNISRRVLSNIIDLFPGSIHSSSIGREPEDQELWDYAARHGHVVVTKDSDFYRMSAIWGPPPKVIWLRVGNGGTRVVVDWLRRRSADLEAFADEPGSGLLILGDTP